MDRGKISLSYTFVDQPLKLLCIAFLFLNFVFVLNENILDFFCVFILILLLLYLLMTMTNIHILTGILDIFLHILELHVDFHPLPEIALVDIFRDNVLFEEKLSTLFANLIANSISNVLDVEKLSEFEILPGESLKELNQSLILFDYFCCESYITNQTYETCNEVKDFLVALDQTVHQVLVCLLCAFAALGQIRQQGGFCC